MTAKEFLRTIWFIKPKKFYEDAVCEAMKGYAKLKCKQQREICAKLKGFGHEIRNAEEPKFD